MLSRIDNVERPDRKDFIKHLRENGLTLKEYCIKYYDRKDLFTGEDIAYKDDVHYINSLFNSRENLVKFFTNGGDKRRLLDVINGRKEIKELQYAPSTFEARTSILPSPALVSKLGLDYNGLCEKAGLKPRYNYSASLEKISGPALLFVDTREQNPFEFSCRSSVSKLDVGDYSSQNNFTGCFVERKSLEDFCGTMSQGFDRFKNEVERANQLGFHLAVVVEESLEVVLQMNVANQHKFIKGSPDFYLTRARSLCETFPNIQFLFVSGRYRASRVTEEIFKIKGGFSHLDLQFFYDNKKV